MVMDNSNSKYPKSEDIILLYVLNPTRNVNLESDSTIPVFSHEWEMQSFPVKDTSQTISISYLGFLFLRCLRTHLEFQVSRAIELN